MDAQPTEHEEMVSRHFVPDHVLAHLAEISADAITIVDSDLNIVLFNGAAEAMFGWAAGEIIGRPLSLLVPEPSRENHAHHVKTFATAHETTSRFMAERRPVKGLRRDGTTFPVEITISSSSSGDTKYFAAILRDRTEQVIAREAVSVNQQRTARAQSARSAFLRLASHELRTPLNGIVGLSKLILDGAEGEIQPVGYRAHVQDIYECGNTLHAAIEYVISLAESDPEIGGSVTPECLRPIMDKALVNAAPEIEKHGLTMDKRYSDSELVAALSPGHADQLIRDLLDYTINSAEPGSPLGIVMAPRGSGDVGIDIGFTQATGSDGASNRNSSQLYSAKAIVEIFGGSFALEDEFLGSRRISIQLPVYAGTRK